MKLAILFALIATEGAAEISCAPRALIVDKLTTTYAEVYTGAGLHKSKTQIFEIWTSPDGSWTILKTSPANVSCIMASGSDWQFPPKIPPQGEDG